MAKQTTIKVPTKDWKAFQAFAEVEGVKILPEANQVGDTIVVSVKYRDPGYLFYLGYNLCKAMTETKGQPATPVSPADNNKKKK